MQLAEYPRTRFGIEPSERWISLFEGLIAFIAPPIGFRLAVERKWELVSALQKSIRRGDCGAAFELISAMAAIRHEYPYFWRRVCVTACEDVGLADDELVTFVIACSTIFTPMKTGAANYDILCYLAQQMCTLSCRSRTYCSLSLIEETATDYGLPRLSARNKLILADVTHWRDESPAAKLVRREWQRKNDWRAEGLLKYVGFRLPTKMRLVTAPAPKSRVICSLPSFCYDMHTRVGLKVLKRIASGVAGAEGIYKLLYKNQVRTPHIAVGWALFFVEGGKIVGQLEYEELSDLEQAAVAHRLGLPVAAWEELQAALADLFDDGVVDREREQVLHEFYERPVSKSGYLFDMSPHQPGGKGK